MFLNVEKMDKDLKFILVTTTAMAVTCYGCILTTDAIMHLESKIAHHRQLFDHYQHYYRIPLACMSSALPTFVGVKTLRFGGFDWTY
jgi:hypothetical protein